MYIVRKSCRIFAVPYILCDAWSIDVNVVITGSRRINTHHVRFIANITRWTIPWSYGLLTDGWRSDHEEQCDRCAGQEIGSSSRRTMLVVKLQSNVDWVNETNFRIKLFSRIVRCQWPFDYSYSKLNVYHSGRKLWGKIEGSWCGCSMWTGTKSETGRIGSVQDERRPGSTLQVYFVR